MDIVNINTVEYVLTNYIADDLIVTYEAVGYLRQLLLPYIEAMGTAETVESLYTWMNNLFNADILQQINAEFNNIRPEVLTVQKVKEAIIVGLLAAILDDINEDTYVGSFITPWDIKTLLEKESHRDIARFFGIPTNERENINVNISLLPVTVTINRQTFVHDMTYEHVLGILAFYRLILQQHPLSMYRFRFEDFDDILLERSNQRHYMFMQSGYTVNVGPDIYMFYDSEFMRGLLTAAMWLNVDPHMYITNLMEWTMQPGEDININRNRQGKALNF